MTRNLRRHPDVAADVGVPFASRRQAQAALKALIPDNVNFPKGLSMKMSVKGSTLAIQISSKNVAIPTLIATLDEVLEHISVAKKVIS